MRGAVLICLFVLSGCSQLATRAKTDLIGMSRGDIISCAGVPDSEQILPDREVLEWKQDQSVQGPLDVKGPLSLELSIGGLGTCHAVATIKNGAVTKIGYTGPSGTLLGPYAACVPLVSGCLR